MPCCYGGQAIAPMADFKEAWNGRLIQEIRRDLLQGRFHRYCFDSPDCPIVKKAAEAHALGARQEAELWFRRSLDRWARHGYGRTGSAYRWTKHHWLNALGHARRLFGASR